MRERAGLEHELNQLGLDSTREVGNDYSPALEMDRETSGNTIVNLIAQGLSENDSTNEVFYQRNPNLKGQKLQPGSAMAQQWLAIRDQEVRVVAKGMINVGNINPVLLALYFSQYEGDKSVPTAATEQFLTRSPLLSMGRTLRDRILGRWQSGNPPLTLGNLYKIALDVSGHPGVAMLLCHNVTRAFTRGGKAIRWDKDQTDPKTYSDGKRTWTPKRIHPAGKIVYKYIQKYQRELPSIYFLLFSEKEFGTDDPGDWYHYFVTATMTCFGAAGYFNTSGRVREIKEREDRSAHAVDDLKAMAYPSLVSDRLIDLEQQMTNPAFTGMPGYRGWVFANIMSFLEGGYYGKAQGEVMRESRFHLQGALAGLGAVGVKPGRDWVWYVPRAGDISEGEIATGFQVQQKMADVLDANGKRITLPKKSGP
jgi:hypothetical protein